MPSSPLDPLLVTKLHAPRTRGQLVMRPRLMRRLQQGTESALTLISAPAGYGKTTLLSQWLASSGMPATWLSLEAEDNEPGRFLSYFIAALQALDPMIGQTALELVQTPKPAPMETILAVLTNSIANSEVGDFACVLDDYHVITSESIDRAVVFLLEHAPPQVHVIIATRADPSLPLARWRARGKLTEVRAADLRFVTDEVSAFFQVAMGLNLAQQDIVALQARIEGWAAGLQLAALSLNNCSDISGFLQSFTGTHYFVLDYLSEEVLSRLPGRVQSFLLQTSILERLCGSLCDAVTEQETGQAMLEMLYRENLFVVALDDERRWYRYHHLFTDVLLNRLQQSQPGLIPELHRRASFWYEQHGLLAEAVQHALAAPDFEYAASLIKQKGWSLVRRGQIHTLLGWLNLLPSDLMLLHPLLCVYHAMMLMATSQMEAARSRLQDAEHCLDSSTPSSETKTIRVWLAVARSDISSYTGDLVRCVAFAQQALDLWSGSEGRMLAGILANSIQAYQVSGDVTTASEQVIAASIAPARVSDNPFVFLRSITSLARLKALQGHLRQALTTYEKTMHLTSQQEELRLNISGSAYYFGLGDLMRERNDLNTAEHLLREGMNIVRETLLVEADVVLLGYTAQARLLQARGKYAQALATLGEFLHVAQQRHYFPLLVAQALATKAQVELAQGDLAAAKHWADSCDLSIEDGIDFLREREYLALARVLIAAGQFEPTDHYLQHALSILDRLLQDAEVKARLGSAIEILLLYALALEAKSHRTESLRMLERALTLAEPEGYVRVFVDEGRPMAALLSRARRQGIAGHYIAGLLTTFEDEGTAIISHSLANPGPLVEPLTERERDVLHLLMTGASNSEIARRLIISLNTVKKHVYNICGKLGVQNRAQAIVKARSLDLL